MKRLIQIEFLKLKPYWPFWILAALYASLMVGLGMWVPGFLEWWSTTGAQFDGILPSTMPVFDFDDIWQNLTFLGRFFFPLLAFLIIMSINNEFTNNTLKQNIIDGMSKLEWVASKILLIVFIAFFAGLLQFIVGLYLGYNYSSLTEGSVVFANVSFVFVYVLQLICFLSLAMFITILVKKSILSFGLLLMLYWPIEQLIRYFLPDSIDPLHPYFPIKSIVNVIENPFPKYIFMEVNLGINPTSVAVVIFYIALYWVLSYFLIEKRDQ